MSGRETRRDDPLGPAGNRSRAIGALRRGYYRSRRGLAWGTDRVTYWCDQQARGAYAIRPLWLQRRVRRGLLSAGSLARVIGLLPRLDARLLVGDQWRVAYVGDLTLFPEVVRTFCPDCVRVEPLPRVAAWRLPQAVTNLLRGADLVVCGLPERWPSRWRARAAWQVQSPIAVDVVTPLRGATLTEWASGGTHSLRRSLARAARIGFIARTTRSFDQLVRFHDELYRPHLLRRHGEFALISDPRSHWRDWIARGGELMLLELDGKVVAGAIQADHGSTCFLAEEGVSSELVGTPAGFWAQTALKAAVIDGALARGRTSVHLGRSLARASDRGFAHKRRWMGQPRKPERSHYPIWTLLASQLPPALAEHLDRLKLLDFEDLTRPVRPPH